MKAINKDETQETLIVQDQDEVTVPPIRTHKQVDMNILVYDITSNYSNSIYGSSTIGEVLKDCLGDEQFFINIGGKCCFKPKKTI